MKIFTLILVWLFTLAFLPGFGQTTSLSGRIELKDQSLPLEGIHVFLEKTPHGAYTGKQGFFELEGIPPGSYQLIASAIGYKTLAVPIEVAGGISEALVLQMEESVMGLPVAVVQSVSLTGGLRGLREVPGSAHYLSPRELQRFQFTDVNRVLRSVPGVNIQEEDGFGLRPNIGLRGAGAERSSKITLMEDGVLAAPAPYAAPAAYYFPTIGRMQAIEILKGSSQVRFGPYTTGGAINLISTAIPDEFAGQLNISAGSFGNRNLHAYVGNSHQNFGYVVESFQFQSNGFKTLDGGGDTGFDKQDFLAKFRVNTGPKARIGQSLTLKLGQTDELSDETYLGLAAADFEQTPYRRYAGSQVDRMDARQRQISLRHIVQFSRSVDVTTVAYRQTFHRNWYKLDKVKDDAGNSTGISALLEDPAAFENAYSILTGQTSAGADALQVKANNRDYRAQGVQTVAGFRWETGALRHHLDIGLRYHYDEMDRFQWVDDYRMDEGVMKLTRAGEPGLESNRILSATAFAVYGQYKLQAGNWTFIPGLRHEDIEFWERNYGKADPGRTGADLQESRNQVRVWIPGLGVDYKISPSTQVFAGVHKGFSPPGAREGTEPEQSVNYEIGSRIQRAGFSGQVVWFFNDYENLLGADLAAAGGGGSGDLFNGGAARTLGLEFQSSYDLLSGTASDLSMPLTLAYTFTDATFANSFDSDFEGWGAVMKGDQMPYLARHQLSVQYSLESLRWGLNASARLQSPMRTEAGQGPIPANELADSFFLLDLSGHYQLHPNIALFASAMNLMDAVYVVARHPAGLRPAMPRTLLAGIRARF